MSSPEQISGHEQTLDAVWFERLRSVYFEDYEKLSGHKDVRELEKVAFLSGVTENPALDYPNLEQFNFADTEESLLTLKHDVLAEELNPIVQKIYRTKINEMLATVRMLAATKDGDDRRFDRYSRFIHGAPTPENTAYVLESIGLKIARGLSSENEEQKIAAGRIHELVSGYEFALGGDRVSRDILPAGLPIKGRVESAAEVVDCFTEVLTELNIDGWQVVVDTEKGLTNFSVSQEYKTISVPSDEQLQIRKITKKKLAGLVEHEIKTHIVRRENGERSQLQLLGFGLDRYTKGEEGIATYAEQQVTGATEFAGVPKYFAIAVAKGFDGMPRDFKQTFAVMKDYYLASLKDAPDLVEHAERAAWNDCVRIFRGTTATTPGAVFTKDLAYLGNRDVWHLVHENSDAVLTFGIGKFDPTNELHVGYLTQLGILDGDIAKLAVPPDSVASLDK